MDRYMTLMTLLLFGFHLSSCSQLPLRQHHYINLPMNWTDAQQYCREKYSDLATFESMDDINRLQAEFSYTLAWIGVSDDPKSWKTSMGNETNSWRWSATGETSKTGYQRWGSGQPNFHRGRETCVITYEGLWEDVNCDDHQTVLCYNVSEENKKNYVHIPIEMTWTSAREYCREHYVDLAMIENEEENSEVGNVDPAWIGLYRVPWSWSDESQSSFQSWYSAVLNNNNGIQHCMFENSAHQWGDGTCHTPIVFICQQVVKRSTTVRMTMATDADLTDPAVNIQVLQQLNDLLTSRGFTDFKLRWKIPPRKKEKEECTKDQCDSDVLNV